MFHVYYIILIVAVYNAILNQIRLQYWRIYWRIDISLYEHILTIKHLKWGAVHLCIRWFIIMMNCRGWFKLSFSLLNKFSIWLMFDSGEEYGHILLDTRKLISFMRTSLSVTIKVQNIEVWFCISNQTAFQNKRNDFGHQILTWKWFCPQIT